MHVAQTTSLRWKKDDSIKVGFVPFAYRLVRHGIHYDIFNRHLSAVTVNITM
jgi:hypothetical protein